MQIFMATNTNRNNIKPMFFRITFMVMIFRCLFYAKKTFKFSCGKKITLLNTAKNGSSCEPFFRIYFVGLLIILRIALFCFNTIIIRYFRRFSFKHTNIAMHPSKLVSSIALFANRTQTVFVSGTSIKLVYVFDLLTVRALSCYSYFRHIRFLFKRVCLEPIAGYIPVVGLFYYIYPATTVNYNYFESNRTRTK